MFALNIGSVAMSNADYSNSVPESFPNSDPPCFTSSFPFHNFWFIALHSVGSHYYRRVSLTG